MNHSLKCAKLDLLSAGVPKEEEILERDVENKITRTYRKRA